MKRLILFLLVALMLCGCGAPEEETTPTETTPPPPKEVTVYLSDAICDKVTWRKVTDAFTATTGILVTAVKDPALAQVVHLHGDDAADLLANSPAALLPQLSQTQIPGEDQTIFSKILPDLMDSFAAAPKGTVQFLPIFSSGYGLGYNASFFAEKGWSVPTTWEELWALGDAAKAEGIYLLTYTDPGQLREVMYATLYSVGGADFFRDAAHYKEGIWSGESGKICAQIMGKLAGYTHPMTASHITAQTPEKNLQAWLENEALFFPTKQDTALTILGQEKPQDFQLGIAPVMSAGNGQYVYLNTRYIWISQHCENPVSAQRFLAFLYSDIATDLFREAGLTQPVRGPGEDPGAYKFAAGSFLSYHAAVDAGSLQKIFLAPFSQMVNGTLTPEEWIRNTENALTAIRGSLK